MRFVTWLLSTAAALAVATWLIDGIYFTGPDHGWAEVKHKLLPLLLVALILGVISSFVKPVVTFFSIPFIIFTLGLFLLVINALMLLLTSWVSTRVDLGWSVENFVSAVLGAIIVSVVSFLLNAFLPERRGNRRRA